MTKATLTLRIEELRRRVEALPSELDEWLNRVRSPGNLDLDAHASQLEAVAIVVRYKIEQQRAQLAQAPADAAALGPWAQRLGKLIVDGQKLWSYFRDKLELRFSPSFKEPLWLADTVAFDCHRTVLDDAADKGIVHPNELREPPLTYLDAEPSPATWVRGARPNDGRDYLLGNTKLPIPLVSLPWESVGNLWELVVIAHEVGHDLEADFQLRRPLATALRARLAAAGVPEARMQKWLDWQGEVFADLAALQLVGPAFLDALVHLLLLAPPTVTRCNPEDPHPTPYLRVLLDAMHARTLAPRADGTANPDVGTHADRIVATWREIYAQPSADADTWLADAPHVIAALVDTPWKSGSSVSLRTLIRYDAVHDKKIRAAVEYLSDGQNKPTQMPVRHVVAAARIAADSVSRGPELAKELSGIHDRTARLIRAFAPKGTRATDESNRHRAFLEEFAKRFQEDP